ncbi:MAG: hypothetical protein S4CHLAM37_11010 [Chlamydiia bacterium]|nr:hypothetical protein [Chlamydiia bacterium]
MFAVLYQGYVKPGLEDDFREAWKMIATYFVKEKGALGSSIHKSEEGYYVTYSRWPDKATRDASWPKDDDSVFESFPDDVKKAVFTLKSALDEKKQFPEVCMKIIEEL